MPPARVANTATSRTESQWWIVVNGEPEGPYGEAYVRLTLEQSNGDMLVCPVGGSDWRPARAFPAFAGTRRDTSGPRQRQLARGEGNSAVLLIRALGVYAVFVAPTLCGLGLLATLTGGALTDDLPADSPLMPSAVGLESFWIAVDLGTTVYLVLCAWRLLGNTPVGVTATRRALWIRMICTISALPIAMLWLGLVALQPDAPGDRPIGMWHTVGQWLFFGASVYELVMLIWLHLNRFFLTRAAAMTEGNT